MKTQVLLGDEAVAMGAIDAGVSIVYGYPGTPSTEIIEYLQAYIKKQGHPIAKWCCNEKTAYEGALGVSMAGKRSMVTMKHVGLNVASDPFMNSALLKIHGGLVVAVADDPGMHSSQDEQDSRYYADFAKIICFEPRNQQEAYQMTQEAFSVSEKFHIPVMLRLVTRLAHSRAVIQLTSARQENSLNKTKDKACWTTIPSCARKMYQELLDKQPVFLNYSEDSPFNKLTFNENFSDYGVITTGLGGNYFIDNLNDLPQKPSHLHLGVYPIPVEKIRKLAGHVKKILVIEEGYPFVEKYLRGLLKQNIEIHGKQDGFLPALGELTPDDVRHALHLPAHEQLKISIEQLPQRPPQLCAGCPHIDTFIALNEVLADYDDSLVTSDIGCYSLGFLPPYSALDSLVSMGASIGMAKGAAESGVFPVVATIGDSTFIHSGITALIDAIEANANMTLMILDNSITAMTGGQSMQITTDHVIKMIEGLGVEKSHLKLITPLKKHHAENIEIIRNEIKYTGLSVIIAKRECIQILKK